MPTPTGIELFTHLFDVNRQREEDIRHTYYVMAFYVSVEAIFASTRLFWYYCFSGRVNPSLPPNVVEEIER